MTQPVVIDVRSVSKTFRLPHRTYSTLKERMLHPFQLQTYEELRAVENVEFQVAKGEFFGIVGRNGSGKSTLLKLLAGIYRADAGEVQLTGRLSPFIELGVGFNPDLTARDNVLINAVMLGLSRREARRRFDEIIEFAELEEFLDLKLKNYSSGMSVRLAFSVAIQADAELLLVDEVLAVGDAAFQQKCYDEFDRLKASDKTIVFVTHDMHAVQRFCDRAMLMERGNDILQAGPEEVSKAYNEVNFGNYVPKAAGVVAPHEAREGKIVDAWFVAPDGERRGAVAQEDALEVHLDVEIDPSIGATVLLNLRNSSRHTVFVTEMHLQADPGPVEERSRRLLRMRASNWLAPGTYDLSATLTRREAIGDVLDSREDVARVLVHGDADSGGVVMLPHDWTDVTHADR